MSAQKKLSLEDMGPLLTLGDRVVWLFEHGPEHGWVRWIGRIPVVSPNWAIGVEFDNPIGAGDGKFGGKRYFYARNDHAYFLPNSSLLRAADYNSTFRTESLMRRSAGSSRAKMYTFPHKYNTARCAFTEPQALKDDFPADLDHFHSGKDGSRGALKSKSKLHRTQSTGLRECSDLSDYENWLDKDPCNVRVQSWKSSHSVMSCPPVLLPRMLVTHEVTSSSESDLEFGSLRSLMACFTLGPHRRKKRRKKKKKGHRLVIAAGRNGGNYCYPSEGMQAGRDYHHSYERARSAHTSRKESCPSEFQDGTSRWNPKQLWRFSLQEQSMMRRPDTSVEAVNQTTENQEEKLPPKLPPKTITRKKRPAPPPPPEGERSLPRPLLRARSVPATVVTDKSFLRDTGSANSTQRRSHKKPAPQPPRQDVCSPVLESVSLGNKKTLDAFASHTVPESLQGKTSILMAPKAQPVQVQNCVVKKSSSFISQSLVRNKPHLSNEDSRELGKNMVDMVTKPELPLKTIPDCKNFLSDHKMSTSELTVPENSNSLPGLATSKISNELVETVSLRKKPVPSRTPMKGAPKCQGPERQTGSLTLHKTGFCPPILEEEENYGMAVALQQANNLETVLKRNSNVFELLDAFSKLELNSEDTPENNDLGSPKLQKKQTKSLKSLFQKHPAEGSKVVSTKWTYTPMEARKEKLLNEDKAACSFSEVKHAKLEKGVVDEEKKENAPNAVLTGSTEIQNEGVPLQCSSDLTLVSHRVNLNPVSQSSDFGNIFNKLRSPTAQVSLVKFTPLREASVENPMQTDAGGSSQEQPVEHTENSPRQGEKLRGRVLPKSVQASFASSPEPAASKASPMSSPATSTNSNSREGPNKQRPPVHPNSPTAQMQAKLPTLFRQLEEAISKGEHDRAAILARELAMCKVSCSLKRVKKAVPDSRQFMVKMYVEDKKSHVGPISLPVYPEMTLSNLKKKIEAEYNFPVKIQRWILGKNLATDDSATLEHYGVSHSACPVFLYLVSPAEHTSNEQQDHGEPSRVQRHPPRSVASTEEASEAISPPLARRGSNASSTLDALLNDQNAGWTCELCGIKNIEPDACAMCGAPMNVETPMDVYDEVPVADAMTSEAGDEQLPRALSPQDYARMMELEEQDLVPSMEAFECSVCFLDVGPGEGALLRDCLHMFCRDCLSNAVRYAEEAMVKCPFRNEEYSCSSHLQEREIKALVPPEVYEYHLSRSVKTAESQAPNSFHCKTADCPGWCMLEDNVNVFTCPVCHHSNCLTCRAIHEGKNCLQYQDELDFNAPNGHEARQTKDYLDNMVKEGQAMHCPQCQVIVMKKWGCDWLKCSVCQMEICWVTKGPRWGPNGKGDTSAGCKCGVNGVKCHPKCNYCH
ncbi:unnamed protein product [Ixodes persulcatus]